jgi:hypothetical protein
VGFSKVIPANGTSKTEYSNTQQGLPGVGYTLARNKTNDDIVKALGLFSAEKHKEYELLSSFSFHFLVDYPF